MSKRCLDAYHAAQRELEKAIINNKSCVDKLLKYEKRKFAKKIPVQKLLCIEARKRLYNAWDAVRNFDGVVNES